MCGGKVGKVLGDANPGKVLSNPLGTLSKVAQDTESINLGHRVNTSLGIGDKFTGILYQNKIDAANNLATAQATAAAEAQAQQDAQDQASAAAGATSLAQRRKGRVASLLTGALGGSSQGQTTMLGGG